VLFTGHEHDSETGLIYMKARFYDPDVGRFLSQDTYLGNNSAPPSLNRYLYAYNNPNLYIDPDGHSVAGMDMDRSGFRHTLPEKFNRPEHEAIREAGDKGGAIGGALVIGAVTGGLSISACVASGVCSGLATIGGTAASLSDPDVDSLVPSGKITKNTGNAIDAVSDAAQKAKKKLSATPTKENKSGSIEGPQQSKSKNKEDSATKSNCVCGAGRCFVAGTLISTIDGLKSIEDVQLGDLVAARDENNSSGEISWKPVTELFFNDDDRTTNLVTLENAAGEQELYEVTDNHPFYIDGRGWVDVDHLEPGMQVPSSKGGLLTIITIEVLNSSPVTYNIEVDEFHTYFVGGFGAWVHNQNNPNCSKVCGSSDGSRQTTVVIDPVTKQKRIREYGDTSKLPSGPKGLPSAKDFEKQIAKLPPGERVAKIKEHSKRVAEGNGWTQNSKLTKKNKRDVYQDDDGNLWALDSQHGAFEKLNSKGKHQGEFNFDLKENAGKLDKSGGHDLIVK